nr:MAG TPA: hypothetical protein [Caudoviricetes sp.]
MFGAIPIPTPSRLFCARCLWPYGVALSPAPRLAVCAASLPPSCAALVPLLAPKRQPS